MISNKYFWADKMQPKFWRGSGKKTLAHFLLPITLLPALILSFCDAGIYSTTHFHEQHPSNAHFTVSMEI